MTTKASRAGYSAPTDATELIIDPLSPPYAIDRNGALHYDSARHECELVRSFGPSEKVDALASVVLRDLAGTSAGWMKILSGLREHLSLLRSSDIALALDAATFSAISALQHSATRVALTDVAKTLRGVGGTDWEKVLGDAGEPAPSPLVGHLSAADVEIIAAATGVIRNRELQVTFEDED